MSVTLSGSDMENFIATQTVIGTPPIIPEIQLYLATEITPIWQATETARDQIGIEPPFWAFPWAGGQAVARYVLDNPQLVLGRSVLDFGAGSGLVAIAAALAGAKHVRAVDIDPMACAATRLNAALNRVDIETAVEDIIGQPLRAALILVGDMCYERQMAERMTEWLRGEVRNGVSVLIGDPGRTYLPRDRVEAVACYTIPTTLELEDKVERNAVVWRLLG